MFQHSISFVVPAFNEQENISTIAEQAHMYLSDNFADFEIVIVDDGSTDATSSIGEKLTLRFNGKVKVYPHKINRGYGAALRTGLFNSSKDLIFYTDADNQFEISEITKFMEHIDSYDLVIGYRSPRCDSKLRIFASRVYNRLVYITFGLNIHDIDCSFKLFTKKSLALLSIDTDEFLVDTELLLKSKLKNFKIKEIPVTHYPRAAGKSTVKPKHIFTTLRDLLFLYRKLKSERKI